MHPSISIPSWDGLFQLELQIISVYGETYILTEMYTVQQLGDSVKIKLNKIVNFKELLNDLISSYDIGK